MHSAFIEKSMVYCIILFEHRLLIVSRKLMCCTLHKVLQVYMKLLIPIKFVLQGTTKYVIIYIEICKQDCILFIVFYLNSLNPEIHSRVNFARTFK